MMVASNGTGNAPDLTFVKYILEYTCKQALLRAWPALAATIVLGYLVLQCSTIVQSRSIAKNLEMGALLAIGQQAYAQS